MTALNMDLYWLRDGRCGAGSEAGEHMQRMCDNATRMIQSVRRICADLRPTILDDLGLSAAIEWQVREFQQRTGMRCDLRLPPSLALVERSQASALFRILQESLTNIARHANATRTRVDLTIDRGTVRLQVSDNGRGIAMGEARSSNSLGILGMRERALQWHGSLSVERGVRRGTVVTLRMPIAKSPGGSGR